MNHIEFNLADRETIFTSLPRGGVGAEIGVDTGDFSEIILRNAEPSLLFLVDCWKYLPVEVYGNDPANKPQVTKDQDYRHVFSKFLADPRVRVLKAFSIEAAAMFPDNFFDWIYLDANHLQCYEDIQAWWPRVKPSGILAGHDYCTVGDYIRVKEAVDRFVAETGLPLLTTDDPIYKCWIIERP